jgi:hypothetical protein
MTAARTVERVRGDVIEQRLLDRYRGQKIHRGEGNQVSPDLLKARMRALSEAMEQPDEPYAQRQSLIDLAAVATELASTYPRPQCLGARTRVRRSTVASAT